MWRCFWTGVRFPSPPPFKSTHDESPRISRAFCYAQQKTPRYAWEFKSGEAVVVMTKRLSFAYNRSVSAFETTQRRAMEWILAKNIRNGIAVIISYGHQNSDEKSSMESTEKRSGRSSANCATLRKSKSLRQTRV